MARASMADFIAKLRLMTEAETASEDVDGEAYWTDEQLEEILDENGVDLLDIQLNPKPLMVSGSLEWTRYYIPAHISKFLEGGAELSVVDSRGIAAPSYTLHRERRLIEFDADTGGLSYYLRGRAYDLNSAAAEVWLRKASLRSKLVDFRTGAMNIKEDQEWQHCMDMYRQYSTQAGFKVVSIKRTGYV